MNVHLVGMDPDLESIAGHFEPEQRRRLAEKLERWADQLQNAAALAECLTGAENPERN